MAHGGNRREANTYASSAVQVLTRLWLSGATGLVRGATPGVEPVRIARGGLVDPGDAARLRALIWQGGLQFSPYPVPGPSDRSVLARLLAHVALGLVGTPARAVGPVVEVLLLAPGARVAELELLEVIPAEAAFATPLTQGVVALERLGLLKIHRAAHATDVARPSAPRHAGGDEHVPVRGGDVVVEAELDASLLAALEDRDEELEVGLATARALLARGQWEMAERALLRLRDHRLDDARVLALLALAKLGDATRLRPGVLADALRWTELAEQLGAPDRDTVQLIEAARRSLAHAEGVLAARADRAPPTLHAKEA